MFVSWSVKTCRLVTTTGAVVNSFSFSHKERTMRRSFFDLDTHKVKKSVLFLVLFWCFSIMYFWFFVDVLLRWFHGRTKKNGFSSVVSASARLGLAGDVASGA